MTHALRIEPMIPETVRFKIKQLLEKEGYIVHSGCTYPSGDKTHNDIIFSKHKNKIIDDMGSISDGFHTFDELYEFRKLYNAAFFNELAKNKKYSVHKSIKHYEGDKCFGNGWFIVVAVLPTGMVSNHYKLKDWDLFQIPEEEKSTIPFDGHTAQDVINRMTDFVKGLF